MEKIRRFVIGVDEPVWVEVLNRVYREREDWRAITVKEFLVEERHPSFDSEGRFIIELDGEAVGYAHADVDKFRTDQKGFIRFGVAREFRGRGLEGVLLRTALSELKTRGMRTAKTGVDSEETDHMQVLEGLGFNPVRVFTWMENDLKQVSQDIEVNREVTIISLHRHSEEDVKLFNWLDNETFKEDFDYHPTTLDETRSDLLADPSLTKQEVFFAGLGGQSVGFIHLGIDENYDVEKKVKAGEVFAIGVLKPYRRQGIGTRLMLHGLETLKASGMTKATLAVDDYSPTKAMKLYEMVGFRVKSKSYLLEREL